MHPNTHSHGEHTAPSRVCGSPKAVHPEMCAPPPMNQSDLVWRGESLPCSDCRQFKREEEAGGDGSGAMCENVPFRFTQTLHYSPGQQRLSLKSPTASCDSQPASKQPVCPASPPANRQNKITQSANQTCVHMFCL